jgi:hypothetical protein
VSRDEKEDFADLEKTRFAVEPQGKVLSVSQEISRDNIGEIKEKKEYQKKNKYYKAKSNKEKLNK